MRHMGFSLIELMVVVAILAVLVAVATPSYQEYLVKTRIASTLPIMHKIMNDSLDFYNNGEEITSGPQTLIDLGLPADGNISNLSPYFDGMVLSVDTPECFHVIFQMNPSELGLDSDIISVNVDWLQADVGNMTQKACAYSLPTSSGFETNEVIENCENTATGTPNYTALNALCF